MRHALLWRLAVVAMLPMQASLRAAGQGSAGYDYPGTYAGRFDGMEDKGGAKESGPIAGTRSTSAGRRTKARKTESGKSLAPAAKGRQGYWDVPSFQGGTKVSTQKAKSGRRLKAK
jgi:hypothetical protein